MSSTTPVSQQSNQTMVTFLTQSSADATPVSEQRVFDFEITKEAQTYYQNAMSIIQYALLDGKAWSPTTGVGANLTSDQIISTVQQQIALLNSWSRYKYVDSNGNQQETSSYPSSFSAPSTMSRYMAEGLDSLIRTLSAAGFNPLNTSIAHSTLANAVAAIQADDVSSSPIYNIRSVLSYGMAAAANAVIAGDSSTQSQSIQQLLMVDYVSAGNEILYNEMNSLQTAVNLNQQILSYLNSLQDLMNQKDPQHFLMSLQQLNAATPNYSEFEKETFGDQVLGTTPKFTNSDLQKYVTIMQLKAQGLDPNDPMIQAKYGLISNDVQRLALYTELNSQSPPILPDASVSTVPQSVIDSQSLTAYDLSKWNTIALLSATDFDPMDPTVQAKTGLTSWISTIYYIIHNTPGVTTTTQLLADTDLMAQYGFPTDDKQIFTMFSKYNYYIQTCNQKGLDPSDTNFAAQYDAQQLVIYIAGCQDQGTDPFSDSQIAATGLMPQDVAKGKIILKMEQDLGLSGTAFKNYVNSNPSVLSTYGLTNLTTWMTGTVGENLTSGLPSDSDIIAKFQALQRPAPQPLDESTIVDFNSTWATTQYQRLMYDTIYSLQQQDIDPTTAKNQSIYGITNSYSTIYNILHSDQYQGMTIDDLAANTALLTSYGLPTGDAFTALSTRYTAYIDATGTGFQDPSDTNIALYYEAMDVLDFMAGMETAGQDPLANVAAWGGTAKDIAQIKLFQKMEQDMHTTAMGLRSIPFVLPALMLQRGIITSGVINGSDADNLYSSGLPSDSGYVQSLLGLQTYDLQMQSKIVAAETQGLDLTLPAAQARAGITNPYSTIYYLLNTVLATTVGGVTTPGSIASLTLRPDLLEKYGLPSDPDEFQPLATRYTNFINACTYEDADGNTRYLDPSDPNIAAAFEARDLALFVAMEKSTQKDPLADLAAWGGTQSDIARIGLVTQMQTALGLDTTSFMTYVATHESVLADYGLTTYRGNFIGSTDSTAPATSGAPSEIDLMAAMIGKQTFNDPLLTASVSTTIPSSVLSTYNLTQYDQNLYTKQAIATALGLDTSDPAVKYATGMTDYYSTLNYIFATDSTITNLSMLFPEPEDYPIGIPQALLDASAAMRQKYGFPSTDYESYIALYNSISQIMSEDEIDRTDPQASMKARLIDLCDTIVAKQTEVGHTNLTSEEQASLIIVPGDKAAVTTLLNLQRNGLDLTIPPANGDYSTLFSAFVNNYLIADTATPTPLLGADSVHVLLNLQAAGLDPTDSTVQSTYSLTAQDVADYQIILQIQANGEDPTDEAVQAKYGLVNRNTDLTANAAAGTTPQAFIDVISGQFNGANGLQQILKNLIALRDLAQQHVPAQSGSSVVTQLNVIISDFQTVSSIEEWVQNFTDQNEGSYQTHLNNGITASQALNDTEREQLQQVMFVYQQFYQSATSMLNSLNQLLQTIASNIASR